MYVGKRAGHYILHLFAGEALIHQNKNMHSHTHGLSNGWEAISNWADIWRGEPKNMSNRNTLQLMAIEDNVCRSADYQPVRQMSLLSRRVLSNQGDSP